MICVLPFCVFIEINGFAPANEYLPKPQLSSKNGWGSEYRLKNTSNGFILNDSISIGVTILQNTAQKLKIKINHLSNGGRFD